MAADAALPRVDSVSPFASPPSAAAKARVGRTDYSERLSREVSRGSDRPRPVAPTPVRPVPAARELSDAERSGADGSVGERPSETRRARAAGVSSDSPLPVAVTTQGARAESEGGESVSEPETFATLEQIDLETGDETGADDVAAVVEYDDVDLSNPSFGLLVEGTAPAPPWSPAASTPPADEVTAGSPAGRAEAQAPAAIVELLLGTDAATDSSATVQVSPEAEVQTAPSVPRGFATNVMAAETDASVATCSPGVVHQSATVTADEAVPFPGSDAETKSIAQSVIESSPTGNTPLAVASMDSSAEATAERNALPVQFSEPSVDVALNPVQPEQAAVSTSDASAARVEAPKAGSPTSGGSVVQQSARTVSTLSVTETETERSDSPSVSRAEEKVAAAAPQTAMAAEGIVTPPTEGALEAAAPLAEASSLVNSEAGDLAPTPSPSRHAETDRTHRAGPDAAGMRAAAGNDIASHAASALRAADILDRPIKIRLTPPELGALHVEVSRLDGKVSAQFEVTTPAAQAALNDQLSTLRESLGRAGVIVDRVEVRLAEPSRDEGRSADGREGHGQGRQTRDEDGPQRDDRQSSVANEAEEGGRENGRRVALKPSGASVAKPSLTSVADEIDIQV